MNGTGLYSSLKESKNVSLYSLLGFVGRHNKNNKIQMPTKGTKNNNIQKPDRPES